MKSVLDTNVLVSALISPDGTPAKIMRHTGRFRLCTSPEILDELARVLQYPRIKARYKVDDATILAYIERLFAAGLIVNTRIQVAAVKDDPDDDKFLACAVACQADYIVSGDPHLLDLTSFQTIPIVTPRQFLEILEPSAE